MLPPLRIMPPPSHLHARASACRSALPHAAFVCRLALSHAHAPPPPPRKPPIAAAFCAFAFAFAFRSSQFAVRIRIPPSSPRSPPRRSARDFTNHRGAASACFCRPLLTPESTKLAAASLLNSTYAAHHHHHHTNHPHWHCHSHAPRCTASAPLLHRCVARALSGTCGHGAAQVR